MLRGLWLVLWVLLAGCGNDASPPAPPAPAAAGHAGIETFTFFGLGRQSVLGKADQDRLRRELGAEAVSRRGPVDLEFVSPGWLGRHIPSLDAMNRRLNNDFRERVEHDVLSLRYNYPTRNNPSFERVNLVFHQATRRPLYFEILANAAGAGILDVLKEKYGAPLSRDEAGGKVLLWENHEDWLVVLARTNRLGRPEYLIGIYFTANLEMLKGRRNADAAGGDGGGGAQGAF